MSEHGMNSQNARTFVREYVWLGARPIAQIERKIRANGTVRAAKITYIHADHLNTPRRATNEQGETVWRWAGDAFGAGQANRDVDGDGKKTVIRLRYPGQYYDRESGLFYNHNRDYDPKLGRYIQSDPIGLRGGINRYAYVGGNPVNFVDPSGRAAVPVSCVEPTDDATGCGIRLPKPTFAYPPISNGGGGSGKGKAPNPGGDGPILIAQINPPTPTPANCSDGIEREAFPTTIINVNGQTLSLKRHGIFETGPRLIGPFSSFDNVVNSATRSLGVIGSRISEGITIFMGNSGYYRSLPGGPGGFSPGGLPRDAGFGSNLVAVTSVVSIRNNGVIGDHVGSVYIGLEFDTSRQPPSLTGTFTCR